MGQIIEVPVFIWLITTPGESPILVDTGFRKNSISTGLHYPIIQTRDQNPVEALKKHGYKPDDFKQIIVTHLHWDHCGNNDLFPKARFIVQKDELDYASNPLPVHEKPYEIGIPNHKPAFQGFSYEAIDGDYEITQNIQLVKAPGHTPGIQNVSVKTDQGLYYLASDNIPLQENIEPLIWPSGCFCDLFAYYYTLNQIKARPDQIIPGHEPALIGREIPPTSSLSGG